MNVRPALEITAIVLLFGGLATVSACPGRDDASADSGTSGTVDCSDATDQASCDAAQNLAEGDRCTWMVIQTLTIDAETCTFTPTDRGVCVGTYGLDDGCNGGLRCDSADVEAYFAEVGPGAYEMARGQACRGVPGFMPCMDTTEAPCTCACEIP